MDLYYDLSRRRAGRVACPLICGLQPVIFLLYLAGAFTIQEPSSIQIPKHVTTKDVQA